MLLSALPALAWLGLTVYAVIDCLQTPIGETYRLPRSRWIAVILLLPLLGAVAWLVANRPSRARHGRFIAGADRTAGYSAYGWTVTEPRGYPIGPDDDPEFMAGLVREQRERQRLMTRQEQDRRRREEQRRHEDRDPRD